MFLVAKLIRRLLSGGISFVLLLLLILAGWVQVNGRQIQLDESDAIVVLGASQFDGDPSPVFANRLDRALEVSLLGVSDRIVTVGGKQPGDRFTEASAGRDYLIDSGLRPKNIEAIPTGSDTISSLQAAAVYLNKISAASVTVVSDPAHVTRSKIILEKLGFEVFLAPTLNGPGVEFQLDYHMREVAGIVHFWLIDQWGINATAR